MTVDLTRVRDAAPREVLEVDGSQVAWSEDGKVAVLVATGPAAKSPATAPAAERIARAWHAAWRRQPGQWPDVDGIVAAGVIIDFTRGEVLAAVDRMGIHGLYWSHEAGRLRVATRAADVLSGERPELDPAALYAYVYFHHVPSPLGIFRGVAKLPRAHALHARPGQVAVRRYRLESFVEQPPVAPGELAGELTATLRAAVARSVADETSVGAFLSGGLDSSTVAGLMAEQLRPAPARSFSIGFDAEGYDEMEYARTAVRHFGLVAHEHYLTPDEVLATAPGLIGLTDEPFGNSSLAAAYQCARMARDAGVDCLLAGDGGDELFAGNSRYAKQLLFERYLRVSPALRRGLEPLLRGIGARWPASPAGKALRYVEQALVPLPDRLQSYNYLHRHAPGEVFEVRFLESVDVAQPLSLWRSEYGAPGEGDAVNRMLFLDWAFTLHDNDLVKVNTACRAAGIGVAYPMLDHALVEFACRLPGTVKMHRGELRAFYRNAMRGLLPGSIVDKTKHGFGLPFGVWTRTHPGLRRMSEAALASLATRGIFRGEFLRETLRLHREGHAAYYGELVWVLMALELWLDARESGASASGRQSGSA